MPSRNIAAFPLMLLALLCANIAHAIDYPPYTGVISNPERGFIEPSSAFSSPQTLGNAFNLLANAPNLNDLGDRNVTVVWRLYSLMDYCNTDTIPASYLNNVRADFTNARSRGIKLYIRFAYNFNDSGDTCLGTSTIPLPQLSRIVAHIAQLGSVLRDNADVITHIDAGMLGRYGEWFVPDNVDTSRHKPVVDAWLAALPADRAINVRTPAYKQTIFSSTSALASGFDGSDEARVGHHNDCYLATISDWWTYSADSPFLRAQQKEYVRDDTRFVPMSGETCQVFAPQSGEVCGAGEDCVTRSHCPTALAESAQLHWSLLNSRHSEFVVGPNGLWAQAPECLTEFKKRLGYRFQLVSATLPGSVGVNGRCAWNASVTIRNEGFATPFNPRPLYLVFEPTSGGTPVTALLSTAPAADPRRWLPENGTFTLPLGSVVPARLSQGAYRLHLWMPDGRSSLANATNRGAYAIRFANAPALWNASEGWNSLDHTLTVNAGGCDYLYRNGFDSTP